MSCHTVTNFSSENNITSVKYAETDLATLTIVETAVQVKEPPMRVVIAGRQISEVSRAERSSYM